MVKKFTMSLMKIEITDFIAHQKRRGEKESKKSCRTLNGVYIFTTIFLPHLSVLQF